MILINHKAFHLFREDAYREYCWSVDAYGAYQPASFIYLCFESFKELCSRFGLSLTVVKDSPSQTYPPYRSEKESVRTSEGFYGLVIRVEKDNDSLEIKEALSEGKNVLALLPNEMIGIYYGSDKKRVDQSIAALRLLNIEEPDKLVTGRLANRDNVWWQEAMTDSLGRLFIITDAFLSDGYFMEGYGKSEENSVILKKFIREFSSFKYPLLRVSSRNVVSTWPCHEPITIVFDIYNHGPRIGNIQFNIELIADFEPISPVERFVSSLSNQSKTSFAFQVTPRFDGVYSGFIQIKAFQEDGLSIQVVQPTLEIEITPNYGSAQRSASKNDDPALSKLISVFRTTNLYEEVTTLPELIKIDARACLNRVRSVGEKITRLALSKQGLNVQNLNFHNTIQLAQSRNIFSSKSIGYLHTIRIIGNLASHPSEESLASTDVQIVSYSLACVMEEFLDRKLL